MFHRASIVLVGVLCLSSSGCNLKALVEERDAARFEAEKATEVQRALEAEVRALRAAGAPADVIEAKEKVIVELEGAIAGANARADATEAKIRELEAQVIADAKDAGGAAGGPLGGAGGGAGAYVIMRILESYWTKRRKIAA